MVSSNAAEQMELRKRQAVFDVSVYELSEEETRIKAQLVQITAKNIELSPKRAAVTTESDKCFDELAVVRGSRELVEGLV